MFLSRLLFLMSVLVALSGCTEMKVEGDAKIFQSSAVGSSIQTILGIVLMGTGAFALVCSLLPDRKPRRRTISHRVGLFALGGSIGFMGLFLAAIPFVFPHKLHVTVYPEQVVMANTLSQTGGREAVVPFSDIKSVEIRDERNVVGKLKRFLVFTKGDGTTIMVLAGNNESMALETIQQALADYKTNPPKSNSGSSTGSISASESILSGLIPSQLATSPSATAASTPNSSPPAKEYPLVRYLITTPLPEGYAVVGPKTIIEVGTKLKANNANTWESVTVVAVNEDGTITCNWDTWKSFTYRMMREDLIIGSTTIPSVASSIPKPEQPKPSPKEYSLKRYPIDIPLPKDYAIVEPDTAVELGSKLKACFGYNWETVTVVAINDDGTITCNWEKWKSYTYKMVREDLIIETGAMAPSDAEPSDAEPSDAEPSDTEPMPQPAPSSQSYSLKRYPINISIPKGYATVREDKVVKVGSKLKACYARNWETVTVVAINDDGTINCSWDNWKGFVYKMMREDLVTRKDR